MKFIRFILIASALLLTSFLPSRADVDAPPVDVSPSDSTPPARAKPKVLLGFHPAEQPKKGAAPATAAPAKPAAEAPPEPEPVFDPGPAIETARPPVPAPTPIHSPPPQKPMARTAPPSGSKTESAAAAVPFKALDFPFLEVITKENAAQSAKLDKLSAKIASVSLPDRIRDIFDNSPSGTLIAKQLTAPVQERKSEPVIDLFMQSVRSLHIEMIASDGNMAVVNGHDLYLGDTVIMQTGAFTTQALVKEIKPTAIVFENPVDHKITSITLPSEPNSLQEIPEVKTENLEDIDGITLQERP